MRFIVGLVLTVAVHAFYDSRSSTRMAVVDTHFADASTNLVSEALEIGSGSVTLSRVASPPGIAALVSGVYGANFSMSHPPASPAARTEYFEFNFSGLSPGISFAGMYIVFGTIRGADAPEYLSVSTSLDGHASVVATVAVPVGIHDAELTVPTGGQLPSQFTVRLSPANASANASNSCYLGIGNAPMPGRLVVYTGPFVCPAGFQGCHHESPSLTSRVRTRKSVPEGLRLHGDYGPWQCGAKHQADGSVVHDCDCDCFLLPSVDLGYNACSAASSGHAFAGAVCAGDVVVSDLAEAAAFDSCDTVNGYLTVKLTTSSAEAVLFPRLRRVVGKLEVSGVKTTSASFPLLQHVGELSLPMQSNNKLTELNFPRLQTVCNGVLAVDDEGLDSFEVPMFGRQPLSKLFMAGVPLIDIGSVGGGPTEIDELTIASISVSDPRAAVVEGLTALERVWDVLKIGYVEGTAGKLHWLDGVTLGGDCGSGRGITVSIRNTDFGADGSPRNLTLDLHEASSVAFVSNTDVVALLAPNACGSHWETFDLSSFSGTTPQEMDFGSVGGGPEIIGSNSAYVRVSVSSSSKLPVFRGLSRLRQVTGDSVKVVFMGLETGGFPTTVFDAEYLGTSTSVDITYSNYDGPIAFPNLVSGSAMKFQSVHMATSMEFPVITRFYTWYLLDCPDLVTLDIGSVSGGPTSVAGGNFVLYLYTTALTTFRGLTALTSISGQSMSLEGFHTAFPVSLTTAAISVDTLSITECYWTDTDITMSGVSTLERLNVRENSGLRALRLPNLGGAMLNLAIFDNDVLEIIDVGSVGGGPTSMNGASAFGLLRISGGTDAVPHYIESIQGLDNLNSVDCSSTSTISCKVMLHYIRDLPWNLLNVQFVDVSEFTVFHSHPPSPSAWDMDMTSFGTLKVVGCSNITALRVPDLASTGNVYCIWVTENEHLAELDLGSTGGGPTALLSSSSCDATLDISGTATTRLETVRGLGSLTSVAHGGSPSDRKVHLSRLGNDTADLQDALERVTFPSGSKKRSVVVHDTLWTELRMTGATELQNLNVTKNCCLGLLRFPNIATDAISSGTVEDNPLLPDGCVDMVDTQVLLTLNRGGNLAATACPA
eukprot:TRINITY_DN230_c0_g1_i1.p1 TRINITY_DN230_c0_g1~~TRINITY_DN230_c0_g1_i1.p1  ORF type:complete len:1109 (+),score=212.14 TRINITY_DN230_c0_g1_i1:228-3554(+)